MKWLWRKITNGLAAVSQYLEAFGPAGLFAIALLDSAFIPLPGGPDAVMIVLSTARPAMMPVYALAATIGSTIGCVILYYISRRAGRSALEDSNDEKRETHADSGRDDSGHSKREAAANSKGEDSAGSKRGTRAKSKSARVKELIDRYDVLSVLVASLLPPPFPFKLFVITAGVFRLNVVRFAIAVAAGRAARFFLEGYIAVQYGDRAKEVLAKNFPAVGLALAGLVVAFFVLRGLMRRRKSVGEAAAETQAGTQAERAARE